MDPDSALLSTLELRTNAELAHLSIQDDEVTQLRHELGAILAYVTELGTLDVSAVPPMTHAVALPCPLRAEVVGTPDDLTDAIHNAPATTGSFFSVPAIRTTASSMASDTPDPGEG